MMRRAASLTHGRIRALVLTAAAALSVVAAYATGLDRLALWQVVRVCVANFNLTGASFPCLAVNLSGGEARGDVVFRQPLSQDTVLVPTRRIVGIEDPLLQAPDAPNYFDAAWRAQSFLVRPGAPTPERSQVALVVNSAISRSQDQLHIHIGCLFPFAERTLARLAPFLPIGEWSFIGPIPAHTTFWGTRVRGSDLAGVDPFRLAEAEFAGKAKRFGDVMIMVAGARVEGEDQFLILGTYEGAPHAWYEAGSDNLLAKTCPLEPTGAQTSG
jgi:CDP-diacylglycerol pyrophosphatase